MKHYKSMAFFQIFNVKIPAPT